MSRRTARHDAVIRTVDRTADGARMPGVYCHTCGLAEWSISGQSAHMTARHHHEHGDAHRLMGDATLPGKTVQR